MDDVKFNKKTHKYKVNKKTLISVTQFVHLFFKPFDKKIAKYVAASRKLKGEDVTAKDVRAEWNKSAEDGTAVHEEIQKFILRQLEFKDVKLPKAMKGVEYFVKDVAPAMLKCTPEMMLYDTEYGIAGTTDLVVFQLRGNLMVVHIIDWKTNKDIKMWGSRKGTHELTKHLDDCHLEQYTLQLSVYAWLLQRQYNVIIDELKIVHLTDTGVNVHIVPYKKSLVEAMLEWYKQSKKKSI
jgi:ATP-dependent exoDNAse (exonuclease V) beta subunit